MFASLVTAAGLPALNTSLTAALVLVGAFPLGFACYKLYKRMIGRV